MVKNDEHQFESDIEAVMTGELGWQKATERGYLKWRDKALDLERLVDFVKATQQLQWRAFERTCGGLDVYNKFYRKFEDAVGARGLIDVLRNGFHAGGKKFFAVAFRPENRLNATSNAQYAKNICTFVRQWHYSPTDTAKSVDVVLMVNGIPLAAIELKDENRDQTVKQAMTQWMTQRNPKELAFRHNRRVLAFFAVDLNNVYMTTELKEGKTRFLPFNRGSNGPGNDGGAGNPPWTGKGVGPNAPTDYLWHDVLQKDSFLDILQKFVNYDKDAKRIVFPRYHQLDVVRKVIGDVQARGAGRSYLVQHSAGSGKSNSIAWIAYRLASLFDEATQKERVFLSYLVHLLPADPIEKFQLADSVTLEYYKLRETFAGAIKLQEKKGACEPPKPKTPSVMEQKKDLLQTVIDQINAQYAGDFSEQDRVIMEMIVPILFKSKKLQSAAATQDEKVYMDGVFPGVIEQAILEAYKKNDKAFKSLLENKEKFDAFKLALAKYTFEAIRLRNTSAKARGKSEATRHM